MTKKKKNTEPTIIDIWQDKSMCNELMKKYQTETSIEAIGKFIMDTRPTDSNLLKDFWGLEGLCEEAIVSSQKELSKSEELYRKSDSDQKEILKVTQIIPLHNHKMELRNASIWLKTKIREIDQGIIPKDIILRLSWNGTRDQLYNGFDHLRNISAKKKTPYFSANDRDLNNFIDSRFLIDGVIPQNNSYKISWNSDKHDLTTLFKELKSHKLINNTVSELAAFIVDTFPGYIPSVVTSYLDGEKVKKKYSLNITLFN